MEVAPEVAAALAAGGAVVALESTLLAHGLPAAESPGVAAEVEDAVRAAGAVPATVAVLDGVVRIGLDPAGLARVTAGAGIAKLSLRDVPVAVASRADGATTVAATAALAARAGIRVFATGGLGGVHRGARDSWDESADLPTLARTPIVVVCSGVKSILDTAATVERLETLGVTVLGYRTDRFPGFYLVDSGHPVPSRVDGPEAAAAVLAAGIGLDLSSGVVVGNPVPAESEVDPALHDRVLAAALADAERDSVRGAALTPYLLARLREGTGGASLVANVALIISNAGLAGRIAVAFSRPDGSLRPAGLDSPDVPRHAR
jgi:pseudouridylate synthase